MHATRHTWRSEDNVVVLVLSVTFTWIPGSKVRSPDYNASTLPCQAFSPVYSVTFSYNDTELTPFFRNTAEKIRGRIYLCRVWLTSISG